MSIKKETFSGKEVIEIRLIKYLPHTTCLHQFILTHEMIEYGHVDYAIKLSNEKIQKLVKEETELINKLNNHK